MEPGRTRFLPDRDHGTDIGYKDEDGSPLVEKILDVTGQKGYGQMDRYQCDGTRHSADPDR